MLGKVLGFLIGVAVLSVALGMVGLLRTDVVDAQTPIASRSISPTMVSPGGRLVVTITTSGFNAGLIRETLPQGFSYVDDSVTPNDVRAGTDSGDVIFTISRTSQFSYEVTASGTVGGYIFAGSVTYLDSNNDRKSGGVVGGDSRVAVSPEGISADRVISPTMVSPGGRLVVTITTSGFNAGLIRETLPQGFSYVDDSVTPNDVRAGTDSGDVIFTISGTSQFSYEVTASGTSGRLYLSLGSVRYLDSNSDRQPGGPVMGTDMVTVRVAPTPTPTPTSRRGAGGGGGGGYTPLVATATPMPTRAPSTPVPTIAATPTPIVVPTIAPTMAPTPEPTRPPEPTEAPKPTAAATAVPAPAMVEPTEPARSHGNDRSNSCAGYSGDAGGRRDAGVADHSHHSNHRGRSHSRHRLLPGGEDATLEAG